MSDSNEARSVSFDRFELAVAVLLGLAAIGAAWSSHQSSLWGGKSIETFAEAASIGTKASTEHDRAEMDIAHDFECDLQAKERILQAIETPDKSERERLIHQASYLYAVEMSEIGYAQLRLPPEFHTEGDLKKHEGMPFEVLKKALDVKLGKEYEDAMLVKGKTVFSAADKRFAEGRDAGSTGDLFDLNTVVFTVSLFFGGLGLVFKTRIRWYFLISGVLVFVCGFFYLVRTPWA
jgi:hypothetical protein